MVATRAAVDRCGPGHVATPLSPTGTEDGQGRGGGFRIELCGEDPEASPSPGGTVYYPMDVDDVPAARGSRPDRLSAVSGPQERVPRRIVEQIVDIVPVVPHLHVPAPQTVDSVVEVLKILDKSLPDVEKVIEVPKILQHTVLQRSSLQEPQMVDQLVTVPTNPDTVLLVFTRSPAPPVEDQLVEVPPIVPQLVGFFAGADGYAWRQLSGPTGVYWWRVGSSHTQWAPHRQARAEKKYLPGLAVNVPVIMLFVFQQSKSYVFCAAIQFIDRVPDLPIVPQKRDSTVQFLNKVVDACCAQQLPMVQTVLSLRSSTR